MQGIVSSFARDYMLPPFYITTEVHATRRNYGHYMTNFGASLSSIMFGMTGLQFGQMGSDPTGWGGTHALLPFSASCPCLSFLCETWLAERRERRWRRGRGTCRCVAPWLGEYHL